MTQKVNMYSDLADWKEVFLFFYWDVKQLRDGRPKEGYIVDRLIVEFFQQTKPSMAYEGPATSWDRALYRLMGALRVQLGFDTAPEATALSHHWLGEEPGPNDVKAPFVDWVRIETETHLLFTYANSTVDRFLNHLANDIYGALLQREEWTLHNPFLVEFQKAHGAQPWGIPVPLPGAAESLEQIAWPDAPILASKAGLVHSRLSPIRFGISLEPANEEGNYTATLKLPEEHLMNARLFHLAKRYYSAMLRWVGAMRETGEVSSLSEVLNAQFHEWVKLADEEGNVDSLLVSRNLWEACRGVGSRPIEFKPAVSIRGLKKPINAIKNGGFFGGY